MLISEEICATCKWKHYDKKPGQLACGNWHSDSFTDDIEWNHVCEYWENEDGETEHVHI